jgi:hypothetical protein
MPYSIKEIPFWGRFYMLFSNIENFDQIFQSQEESQITDEQWIEIARSWRNDLLSESDWSQIPDNFLSEEKKQEWKEYRIQLRNITNVYEDPKEIVFPDLPNK